MFMKTIDTHISKLFNIMIYILIIKLTCFRHFEFTQQRLVNVFLNTKIITNLQLKLFGDFCKKFNVIFALDLCFMSSE